MIIFLIFFLVFCYVICGIVQALIYNDFKDEIEKYKITSILFRIGCLCPPLTCLIMCIIPIVAAIVAGLCKWIKWLFYCKHD